MGGHQQQLAVAASGGPATPYTARTVRLTPGGGSNPNTHNSGNSGRGIPLSHALRSAFVGVLGGGHHAGGGGTGVGDRGSRRRSMDDERTAAAVAATAAQRASHPHSATSYADVFNTSIDLNEEGEDEEMDEQTTTGDIGRHLYGEQAADEQHRTVYGTNWAAGTEAGEVASGGRSGRGSIVGPTGGRSSQGQVVDMEVEVVVPTFDEDEGDRPTRHTERRR